ncbi:uncharacterized protein LACBIDRAFT_308055 [Laccaria bicolor S238N-H82]|uniref:Predicted protein n=1 Tax=Laccaria bicolor (strain S238N-H82 / ATCC MYA-4686) TaxID=486041 RepID=B0DRJ0_LACBS|nr:uncharacterized protein LACBIDRAFT_308055 [Laccaria bicolor S238N-H82]EDR02794.1 predicted protein [Laccaria bicolor S238N-H82]|eukprot:XP_001886504.1 predicted protein [Laccaria bicolor S238N-H82]
MINETTGHVTGLIDFERTTIAPLWECALLPRWLQHPADPEATYEGGDEATRQPLRTTFMDKVGSGQWNVLYELGKPFRQLSDRLCYNVGSFKLASEFMESWVEERLAWAKDHPGIGVRASAVCKRILDAPCHQRAIHLKTRTFDLSRSARTSLESQFWMLLRCHMSKGVNSLFCRALCQ